MNQDLKVMKFGGTSVGSAEQLRSVVEIVAAAAREHRLVVVASAASGVTDRLVAAWDGCAGPDFDRADFLEELRGRYRTLAGGLLSPEGRSRYEAPLAEGLQDLDGALARAASCGPQPPYRDDVLAAGERLSVPLVALALEEAGLSSVPVDAAELIRTDATHGDAAVVLEETFRQVRHWHGRLPADTVPVVTGFIGATEEGATTTLGRGGSDYSAALLASALKASVLERWTDVDGIYTDDPRTNKEARRLACIVLEEAWAWNQAGRLGMHRKALDPLVAAGIPVHVRCTATPEKPGTLILPAGQEESRFAHIMDP